MQLPGCQRLLIFVLHEHQNSSSMHPKTPAAAFGCLSRAGVGITTFCGAVLLFTGKGGKNRRRGKNESEEKRELIFKEDGQGAYRRSWPALILPASSLHPPRRQLCWLKQCPRGGIGGMEALQRLQVISWKHRINTGCQAWAQSFWSRFGARS